MKHMSLYFVKAFPRSKGAVLNCIIQDISEDTAGESVDYDLSENIFVL